MRVLQSIFHYVLKVREIHEFDKFVDWYSILKLLMYIIIDDLFTMFTNRKFVYQIYIINYFKFIALIFSINQSSKISIILSKLKTFQNELFIINFNLISNFNIVNFT